MLRIDQVHIVWHIWFSSKRMLARRMLSVRWDTSGRLISMGRCGGRVERTSLHRIDVWRRLIADERRVIPVRSHAVHFEAIGGEILTEQPLVLNHSFHCTGHSATRGGATSGDATGVTSAIRSCRLRGDTPPYFLLWPPGSCLS